MDQQKIGGFIAAVRRERGLTQRELAERLHVTNKAVSKWELGRSLPNCATLEPLAHALGVTVDELLSGERRPQQAPAPSPRPQENSFVLYQKYVQGYVHGAEVERRRILGLVLLWAGIALLVGQCIYLDRHSYTSFLNVDALNALTVEQLYAATDVTIFPGVTLIMGALGTTVKLTWLWGWFRHGWPGAVLLPLSVALIVAGSVVKRRADNTPVRKKHADPERVQIFLGGK